MTLRPTLALVVGTTALAIAATPAHGQGDGVDRKPLAPKTVRCPAPSPIAASHRVKVFTVGWHLYACLRNAKGRRAVELADGTGPFDPFGSWWYAPTPAGTMVAFGTGFSGHCSGYAVEVVDVRTRRIVSRTQAGTWSSSSEANACSSAGAPVRSMVLRRDGVAAFITGWPASGYEVAVSGPTGLRAIARGRDIDPLSLEVPYGTPQVPHGFDRDQVAWWQGGDRQTAGLMPVQPPTAP